MTPSVNLNLIFKLFLKQVITKSKDFQSIHSRDQVKSLVENNILLNLLFVINFRRAYFTYNKQTRLFLYMKMKKIVNKVFIFVSFELSSTLFEINSM